MKIWFNEDRSACILSGIPPDDECTEVVKLDDDGFDIETEQGNDYFVDNDGGVFQLVPVENVEVEEVADLDQVLKDLD